MQNKRPKLKLPLTLGEKILEIICLAAIFLTILFLMTKYFDLPERVPTHFGVNGKPDAWGDKISLIALPIIMIVIYAGLTILGRFPHVYNYLCEITEKNAAFQYQNARIMTVVLKIAMVMLFTYIELTTIQVAEGKATGLGNGSLLIFLLAFFGSIIFFIVRMVKGNGKS